MKKLMLFGIVLLLVFVSSIVVSGYGMGNTCCCKKKAPDQYDIMDFEGGGCQSGYIASY